MIDLYYGATPNGQKVSIALYELGLPFQLHPVDIMAGEQFTPEFLAINPNNKMPAIVDSDGPGGRSITVWESGAILIYLAEKSGGLIPTDAHDRVEMLKWLFFQMSAIGPMAGQMAFFAYYAREKVPMAIERYRNELNRQMRVMEGHLQGRDYFANTYSIADIAILPWWRSLRAITEEPRPALEAWENRLMAREAVRAGLRLGRDDVREEAIAKGQTKSMSDETYSGLYGQGQYVSHSGAVGADETPSS